MIKTHTNCTIRPGKLVGRFGVDSLINVNFLKQYESKLGIRITEQKVTNNKILNLPSEGLYKWVHQRNVEASSPPPLEGQTIS